MKYASGKYSKFISDRSGMEFPYRERVKEWNGFLVHRSEYEPKHPQLEPKRPPFEPQALMDPRTPQPETFTIQVSETFLSDNGIESKSIHGTSGIGEVKVLTS